MSIPTFIGLMVVASTTALICQTCRWISPSLRNIDPRKGGVETDHDLHAMTTQAGSNGTGCHSAVWLSPKQK